MIMKNKKGLGRKELTIQNNLLLQHLGLQGEQVLKFNTGEQTTKRIRMNTIIIKINIVRTWRKWSKLQIINSHQENNMYHQIDDKVHPIDDKARLKERLLVRMISINSKTKLHKRLIQPDNV